MRKLRSANRIFRVATEDKNRPWTKEKARLLQRVDLVVSSTKFKHTKMLGTVLEDPAENGEWQDVCKEDGGGPLMLPARGTERWVIIGSLEYNDYKI